MSNKHPSTWNEKTWAGVQTVINEEFRKYGYDPYNSDVCPPEWINGEEAAHRGELDPPPPEKQNAKNKKFQNP